MNNLKEPLNFNLREPETQNGQYPAFWITVFVTKHDLKKKPVLPAWITRVTQPLNFNLTKAT